jgi:hypothetical protein
MNASLAPQATSAGLETRAAARPRLLNRLSELQTFVYYYVHGVPNGNSSDAIVVEGRLDHAVLRRAAALFVQRHPVLNSVIVRKFGRRIYWQVPEHELPLDFEFGTFPSDDKDAMLAELGRSAWSRQFDLARERPMRFRLIETPTRSYVQIITCRIYTDGVTGRLIVREFTELYNSLLAGETPNAEPVVADETRRRVYLAHRPLREQLYLFFFGVITLMLDLLGRGNALALGKRPRGASHPQRLELGPDLLPRLKRVAGARRTTVHAVLVAAFARACDRFNAARGRGGRTLRIVDFFSLRRFAPRPVEGHFQNVAMPYKLLLDVRGDDAHLLEQVERQLDRMKRGLVLAYFWVYAFYLQLARLFPVDKAVWLTNLDGSNVMFSNPGPTDCGADALGGARVVDLVSFSQLFPPERVFFVVSTFRGQLRATVLYEDGAFPQGAGELVSSFEHEIMRFAELDISPASQNRTETPE